MGVLCCTPGISCFGARLEWSRQISDNPFDVRLVRADFLSGDSDRVPSVSIQCRVSCFVVRVSCLRDALTSLEPLA